MPELFARAGRAALWAAAAKWFDLIITTLTFLVMVRFIGPEQFGVFGLALLALLIPETVVGGALSESLIQRQELRPGHVAGALALQLALAIVFACVLFAFAGPISVALGHTELSSLIVLLAATLPVLAISAPPAALLQRDLRFSAIAAVDAIGAGTAAVVGVGLGLAGYGLWAMAWMEVARRVSRAVAFAIAARAPLFGRFDHSDIGDLFHFNSTALALRLLTQADNAIPRLFLGLIDTRALGYFNLAQRIFQQGAALVIAPFNSVALPLASRIQDQREKLHAALDGVARVATLFAYPIFLGAAAIAPVLVPLALGPAWAPAVPALQIMFLLGVRAATASFNGSVLRAVGRPGAQLSMVALGALLLLAASPIAAPWGATAMAAVFLARGAVTWWMGAKLLERATGYPAAKQVTIGWESLAAASVMAGVVLAAQPILASIMSGWALVAALIGLGVVVHAGVLSILAPTTVKLISEVMRAVLRRDVQRASALLAGGLATPG